MMTAAGAPQRASTPVGRTVIHPRALRRLTEATVAELTGAKRSAVSVELTDAHGMLSVAVSTPLDLDASAQSGTLVERAAAITTAVTGRFDQSAGRAVGRVSVRLTRLIDGAHEGRRVE